MHILNEINYNGVVTIQVDEEFEQFTREQLDFLKKDHIQEYRLLVKRHSVINKDDTTTIKDNVDHLKQFESYVLETFGDSKVIKEELQHIMR